MSYFKYILDDYDYDEYEEYLYEQDWDEDEH